MRARALLIACAAQVLTAPLLHAILAGEETDLPADTPGARVPLTGEFAFVGALSINEAG